MTKYKAIFPSHLIDLGRKTFRNTLITQACVFVSPTNYGLCQLFNDWPMLKIVLRTSFRAHYCRRKSKCVDFLCEMEMLWRQWQNAGGKNSACRWATPSKKPHVLRRLLFAFQKLATCLIFEMDSISRAKYIGHY